MHQSFYFLVFLLIVSLGFSSCRANVWKGDFAEFNNWKFVQIPPKTNVKVIRDPTLSNASSLLQVRYPNGSHGGIIFHIKPLAPSEHVSFQYDVLFPVGFDFVLGGKMPGLYGGRRGCSGGDQSNDCFSVRLNFDKDGNGVPYLYLPIDAKHLKEFCILTNRRLCDRQFGFSIRERNQWLRKGEWVTLRQTIKLNTPGLPDGRLTVWANGIQRFDFNKIIFRLDESIKIDGVHFSTFFGGNWTASKDETAYFKDLIYETH